MSAATRWTIAIVSLLAGNVIAMLVLMGVAHSGGSEVIPNYYDRAVQYDTEIDDATSSLALAWSADVSLGRSMIEVQVRDRAGLPLDGARVRVTGYSRGHGDRHIDAVLALVGNGVYRAALRMPAVGVHDLKVVVERAGDRFTTPVSLEAR